MSRRSVDTVLSFYMFHFEALLRTIIIQVQHLKQWVKSSQAGVGDQFVAALSINELLVEYPLQPNNVIIYRAVGHWSAT